MPNVSPNIKGKGRGGGFKSKSKLAAKKGSVKQPSNSNGLQCNFCSHGSEEEKVFGKLHSLENVSAHYNCLLFSSGLGQNGEEEEGIEGFYLEDIKKELRRSSKLKCCYCRQNGASIGCLERRCKRSYHFLCGLKAFALFQFTGNFCSYCVDHRPFQEGVNRDKQVECPICMEELIADPKIAVWASCCKKDDWFHKECVQNMANSAGYFFKCPLCNDKDTFTESMQLSGIHVPEQDAVWEMEPNAFSDLYERRIHCDAPVCKCPEGRKQDDLGSKWEILLCDLCGTTGVHIVCGKLPFSCTKWNCSSCLDMLEESSKRSRDEVRQRRLNERNERTLDKGNNSRGGRQNLNATISESNPSSKPRGKGGRNHGRQSLNATIADISPSRSLITSPSTQNGRGKRNAGVRHSLTPTTQGRNKGKRKTGAQQIVNINADSSPSRTVNTIPSTPKRRRTSEPLVMPRKIARLENTPLKELKRALLTPNKEPVVELERIKIKHISVALDIEVEVVDKSSGVSRSLIKFMDCENTTSSDIKCKEIKSFGANKSNNCELNCDIPSDNHISNLDVKDAIKGKDVDENENSSISVVDENEYSSISVSKETVPDINEEKNQCLSTDDNIRLLEESGAELSESALELKKFALTAQGSMDELQLTETEVLKLASNSITKVILNKSDISRFFQYNLSIKKMVEIRNLLESVFKEREAIIRTAQDTSLKKSKQVSPKEKDVISELGSLQSRESILSPSVSVKKLDSPVKILNNIKSSVDKIESRKENSSTNCDTENNMKGFEVEKKTPEKLPIKSPKKAEKLLTKMRSSPRKHLKTPPANISCTKAVEINHGGTTTVTTTTATTPEETGNINNSIMNVSCGIQSEQSPVNKPTTSPRNSFGSPSLLGSPRKVPKSRIASPEKIAQGCILMWDDDSNESTEVPSKNDDEKQKNLADNSSVVNNTYQEEQLLDSVEDSSIEINNVLSDTRIKCTKELVPNSNQECTVANESIVDEEMISLSDNSMCVDIEHQKNQQHGTNESPTSENNNIHFTDPSIQCIEKVVPSSNQECTIANESIPDVGEPEEISDISIYHKEQQHCSTESPTSGNNSANFTDSSMEHIGQLDTLGKQNSTAMLESLGNLENTEKSTCAIPYTKDTTIDKSGRYPASNETQCNNHEVNKKSSLKSLRASNETPRNSHEVIKKGSLKSLRVVQPESKLRGLRIIK